MRKIEYFVANPAGNITIFVTTPVDQKDYQEVASELFKLKDHGAEQVGFIKDGNLMHMSGMEFCGNASRSFGLWYAQNRTDIDGEGKVTIEVSGNDYPLDVFVNTKTNYTKIGMPNPLSITNWQDVDGVKAWGDTNEGVLVDFGGILHLVLWDVTASAELFDKYNQWLNAKFNPPATGVMFLNTKTLELTPVVYVRDVDTTYFEGSCGSGSTATAVALSYLKPDGEYSYDLKQPAGTITATPVMKSGKVEKVFIEGPVEMGEMKVLEY